MQQSSSENDTPKVVGVLAEFDGPEALVAAAAGVRQAGYTLLEAYSPFPVHGLEAALGRRRTLLPWLVFGGDWPAELARCCCNGGQTPSPTLLKLAGNLYSVCRPISRSCLN